MTPSKAVPAATLGIIIVLLFTHCHERRRNQVQQPISKESENPITAASRKSSSLIQDRNGNFWLCNGNSAGVTRYDGKKYTAYTSKDGLSSDFVYTILEDRQGIIWFGTADGLSCFDGRKFSVIPIQEVKGPGFVYNKTTIDPAFGVPKPVGNFVLSILQDNKGVLWFGTSDGIYQHDPMVKDLSGNRIFKPFQFNDSIRYNKDGLSIESILQDRTGTIWFGGRGAEGLYQYHEGTLNVLRPDGKEFVSPIFEDKEGKLWFARRNPSVYSLDDGKLTVFGNGQFTDWVLSMAQDSSGDLWFSNGITSFNGKQFIHYGREQGLCEAQMRALYADKEGIIWTSCGDGRLSKFDGKKFVVIR